MEKPRYRVASYSAWRAMIQRCTQPKHPHFANYGGRGIAICDQWRSDFLAFDRDMGPRPSMRHSIERRDGAKGYEPSNCYWATRKEQNNNRKNNVLIEHAGRTQTLAQWADELEIPYGTLWNRVRAGLGAADILAGARKGLLTYGGKTAPISYWAKQTGIAVRTISQRIHRYGWSAEDALTVPAALGNKIKFLKRDNHS